MEPKDAVGPPRGAKARTRAESKGASAAALESTAVHRAARTHEAESKVVRRVAKAQELDRSLAPVLRDGEEDSEANSEGALTVTGPLGELSRAMVAAAAPFEARFRELEAENRHLKARIAALERRGLLEEPQTLPGAASTGRESSKAAAAAEEEAQMIEVLRRFQPLSLVDAVRRLTAAAALKETEQWVLDSGAAAEAVKVLAPLVAEVAAAMRAALEARLQEVSVYNECRAVIDEGNRDFRSVYDSMWRQIANADEEGCAAYAAAVGALTFPGAGARQRRTEVVELYVDAARTKPLYDAALEKILAGLPGKSLHDVSVPTALKSTARIVEKSLLRVDAPGSCDAVCDVVRAMVVAPNMTVVASVVAAFAASDALVLTRAKDRYDEATKSAGGWRDCMLNFYLAADPARHVCEVQIVHQKMLLARAGLSGHSIYNRVRNASELVELMDAACVDRLGWTAEDATRAGFTLQDRIRAGLATDAEAQAGGFSNEALALKKLLAADADDDDARRCLQLHLDARQGHDIKLAAVLRDSRSAQNGVAAALKKGNVGRVGALKKEAKDLDATRAAMQADAPRDIAARLLAAGATVDQVFFADRARDSGLRAAKNYEEEGDPETATLLREQIKARLRDYESCGVTKFTADDLADAGFPATTYFASGSSDDSVRLWNVDDGACVKTLQGHSNSVYSVAFAPLRPGDETLLLASGSDDNSVRLWNVDDGACVKTLQGHSNWVRSVAFARVLLCR